jgi:hypothetical protein
MNDNGSERAPFAGLTEEEIEKIVERVTNRVVSNFYAEVGRSIMTKLFVWVGMVAAGVAAYFGFIGKGH